MKNYILNIITFIKIGVSSLLVKYLNRSLRFRPKSYLKYLSIRLIAELVKDKESTQYVIDKIADYIYYEKLDKVILFSDIFVLGDEVYILTVRPGIWIGKQGATINELKTNLNVDVRGKLIHKYHLNLIDDVFSPIIEYKKAIFACDLN